MLADHYHFFYLFNFSFIPIENNNPNFNEFITNYKAINHMSSFDKLEEKSNIKDDSNDNADRFIIKHILENFQKLELFFSM